jgi:hypothetical protein
VLAFPDGLLSLQLLIQFSFLASGANPIMILFAPGDFDEKEMACFGAGFFGFEHSRSLRFDQLQRQLLPRSVWVVGVLGFASVKESLKTPFTGESLWFPSLGGVARTK